MAECPSYRTQAYLLDSLHASSNGDDVAFDIGKLQTYNGLNLPLASNLSTKDRR